MGLVKVTDMKTGKLKKFQTSKGRDIAHMKSGKLVVTDYGDYLGYTAFGEKLYGGEDALSRPPIKS